MRFTKTDGMRVAAVAALSVASASACSGILGIGDLPVPVDAGPDTTGESDASDAFVPDTLVADAPADAGPRDVSVDGPADVAADVPGEAPADGPVDAPADRSSPPPSCADAGRSPVLLVSAATSILAYDPSSGASLGTFNSGGTLKLSEGMTLSPNCEVFVADFSGQDILRYDAQTGAYLGVFASTASGPYGVTFGPDGNVYVGLSSGAVVKYDATTGALVGTFAGAQGQGFGGMVFFNGELLVTYVGGTMYRFDGTTGAVIGEMYSSFSSNGPRAPVIGPDGNIYVPVWQSTNVYKFSGTTYGLLSTFIDDASLSPVAVTWLPSGNYQGDIAALSDSTAGNDSVRVYSSNGALVTFLVAPGGGGLNRGSAMLYVP